MCLSISVCIFPEHIWFDYICSILNTVIPLSVMGSPRNKGYKQRFLSIQKKSWRTMLRFAITLLAVITSSTCQKYGCLKGDTQKLEPSPEPSMQECTLYSKCKNFFFPNMVKKYSIVHTNVLAIPLISQKYIRCSIHCSWKISFMGVLLHANQEQDSGS